MIMTPEATDRPDEIDPGDGDRQYAALFIFAGVVAAFVGAIAAAIWRAASP